MIPAVRCAMCSPSRSDQIATRRRDQPLPRVRRRRRRPATARRAAPTSPTEKVQMVSTQPELPVRCCTSQAHRHQDRERYRDAGQRFEIKNRHAKMPVNRVRRRTSVKYASRQSPVSPRSSTLSGRKPTPIRLFSRPRCAILRAEKRSLATDDTAMPSGPSSRSAMEIEFDQTVLAADLPGADAGVPGAVRAGRGRALQADHRRLLRQSRPQRADRRGALDRHHPVVPAGDPALSGGGLGQQFPHRRSRASRSTATRRCWRRWRRSSAASAPGG